MDFLSDLKNKNQFPVIFIGSGITQRYFKNALNWDGLLQSLWEETGEEQSYYSRFHELEQQFQKDKFRVYTKLAQELEEKFDTAFYDGKITMQSLSPEEAHQNEMSPFKRRIAEYFEHLEPREEFKNELKLFGKMIRKARMIVTTNYDSLIEDTLFNQISKKVGNRGLFEPSSELNVLYKIHGSIEEPESLVITQRDYEGLKRTSAIVNAKILSELTSSPILFIGYSLTDNNVQSLLKDLADNMPFDVGQSAKRIGVVNYVKGKDNISESIRDSGFGAHYTQLQTDDFETIYKSVAEINQGFTPHEIAKYQGALRKIIEVKGQEGKLDSVLTSFVELKRLPEAIKSKNLVVALGDEHILYKMPSYEDYLKSYFGVGNKMPIEISIKYILQQPSITPIPIKKFENEIAEAELNIRDRERLRTRIRLFNSLNTVQQKIQLSGRAKKRIETRRHESAVSLFRAGSQITDLLERIKYIIIHIHNYDVENDLKVLVEMILTEQPDVFIRETFVRKFFMAYSLLVEGDLSEDI